MSKVTQLGSGSRRTQAHVCLMLGIRPLTLLPNGPSTCLDVTLLNTGQSVERIDSPAWQNDTIDEWVHLCCSFPNSEEEFKLESNICRLSEAPPDTPMFCGTPHVWADAGFGKLWYLGPNLAHLFFLLMIFSYVWLCRASAAAWGFL